MVTLGKKYSLREETESFSTGRHRTQLDNGVFVRPTAHRNLWSLAQVRSTYTRTVQLAMKRRTWKRTMNEL